MVWAIDDFVGFIRKKYDEEPIVVTFLLLFFGFMLLYIAAAVITGGKTIYYSMFRDHADTFMDFFNSVVDSVDHPYTVGHVIYPPLSTLIYSAIGRIIIPFATPLEDQSMAFALRDSQLGLMLFFTITVVSLFILYVLLCSVAKNRNLVKISVFAIIFLSAPMIFCISRGNSILIAALLSFAFLIGYHSENKFIRYASYLSLAIAVGIKIYPVIFGLLLIKDRDYKDAIMCCVTGAIVFFMPFIFTDGNLSILMENLKLFAVQRGATEPTSIHLLLNSLFAGYIDVNFINIAGYVLTAVLIVVFAAIILFSHETELWELITLASGLIIVIPVSNFTPYSILFLLLPMVMFLMSEEEMTLKNKLALVCFVVSIVLIPGIETSGVLGSPQTLTMHIRIVSIVVLLCIICVNGIKDLRRVDKIKKGEKNLC